MNSACRQEVCCDEPLDFNSGAPPSGSVDTILFANLADYGDVEGGEDKLAVEALIESWTPEYITANGDAWYDNAVTLLDWLEHGGEVFPTFRYPTGLTQPTISDQELQDLIDPVDGPADGLSGITYSPVTGTIFGVRNVSSGQSATYEWDLAGNLLRTITHSNFTDTEGICWMYGDTFAISEENPVNRITIVTIVDGQTTLDRNDFLATSFSTGISAGNLGVEGSGYDGIRDLLYFTTEKPVAGLWQLFSMNPSTGAVAVICDITATVGAVTTDISDIYYDWRTEHVFLLSHENSKVIEINLSGTVIRQLTITGFTQPEGLAFNETKEFMFITGEPAQWARYRSSVGPLSNMYDAMDNREWNPRGHLAIRNHAGFPAVYREGIWQPSNGYYHVRRGFVAHFFYDSGYDGDTLIQPDGNAFDSIQGTWLQSSLAASTARWKVVHLPKPGYSSTSGVTFTAMRELIDRLRGWGADIVLQGHGHNYERMSIDGLPVIINGTGGRSLADFDTPIPQSIVRVKEFGAARATVTCSRFTWEWFNVDGTKRDTLVLTK